MRRQFVQGIYHVTTIRTVALSGGAPPHTLTPFTLTHTHHTHSPHTLTTHTHHTHSPHTHTYTPLTPHTALTPTFRTLLSQVGFRLAQGEALEDILASSDGVSEGVGTVIALEQLLKSKVWRTP
jgi:hypothetical protein